MTAKQIAPQLQAEFDALATALQAGLSPNGVDSIVINYRSGEIDPEVGFYGPGAVPAKISCGRKAVRPEGLNARSAEEAAERLLEIVREMTGTDMGCDGDGGEMTLKLADKTVNLDHFSQTQTEDHEIHTIEAGAGIVTSSAFDPLHAHVLQAYDGGERVDLVDDLKAGQLDRVLRNCGDGLVRFLLVEISKSEGCMSVDEAVDRIAIAVKQLQSVQAHLEQVGLQEQHAAPVERQRS